MKALRSTTTSLQSIIAGMLKTRLVDEVLAYIIEPGSTRITVGIIRNEADVGKIMTSSYNPRSLAKSMIKHAHPGKRLSVVARSCDVRAIIELAKKKQIDLDDTYLIGIVCCGTASTTEHKETDLYILPDEIEVGGVRHDWDEAAVRPNCLRCEYPVPTMADIGCTVDGSHCKVVAFNPKGYHIFDAAGISVKESSKEEMADIRDRLTKRAKAYQERDFGDLQAMKSHERLGYWLSHYFNRCTGCYACRESCPMCHCTKCLMEDETWVKPRKAPLDNMFHLLRLMHVAPHCVNCGQCDSVCPQGIPISKLYHITYKELSTALLYESGIDTNTPLPLTTWKVDNMG